MIINSPLQPWIDNSNGQFANESSLTALLEPRLYVNGTVIDCKYVCNSSFLLFGSTQNTSTCEIRGNLGIAEGELQQ